MSKQKIKAYTLMELVIAMLISALVISITYTAFAVVSRSYVSFRKKNDDIAVGLRLQELLGKDIVRADSLYLSGEDLLLTTDSSTTRYLISPDRVIRAAISTDTFQVNTVDLQVSFEGLILIPATDTTEKQLADAVHFNLVAHGDTTPLAYQKQYSSVNLMH